MKAAKAAEGLVDVVQGLFGGYQARRIFDMIGFPHHGTQVAGKIIHDVKRFALRLVKVVDRDDIGMAQSGHGNRFLNEQGAKPLKPHQLDQQIIWVKEFQGGNFADRRQLNLVNLAHSTATQ